MGCSMERNNYETIRESLLGGHVTMDGVHGSFSDLLFGNVFS
jgi:hypothetical protein